MQKEKLRSALSTLVFIMGCVGFILLVSNTLRLHPVYRQGMAIVRNEPAVIELFGSPIWNGLFVPGTTEKYRYGGGIANLETAIIGPEAYGTVNIFGSKDKDSPWRVDTISVRIGGELVLTYSAIRPDEGFQPVRSQPALDITPPTEAPVTQVPEPTEEIE
jgi:hypothetical protein